MLNHCPHSLQHCLTPLLTAIPLLSELPSLILAVPIYFSCLDHTMSFHNKSLQEVFFSLHLETVKSLLSGNQIGYERKCPNASSSLGWVIWSWTSTRHFWNFLASWGNFKSNNQISLLSWSKSCFKIGVWASLVDDHRAGVLVWSHGSPFSLQRLPLS